MLTYLQAMVFSLAYIRITCGAFETTDAQALPRVGDICGWGPGSVGSLQSPSDLSNGQPWLRRML